MVYNESVQEQLSFEKNERNKKRRLVVLFIFFIALFIGVVVRLTTLQVLDAEKLRAEAKDQYEKKITLQAKRGSILDRNGEVLASNTTLYSYEVDKKGAGDSLPRLIEIFSKTFGKPKSFFESKLKRKQNYIPLVRQVDAETLRNKIPESFKGLTVYKEPKRLYHHKTAAGQLLGSTDIDNKGIMGLELSLNEQLRGEKGYVTLLKDGLGGARPEIEYPRVNPTNGSTFFLTIDLALQFIAEEELRIGAEKNKAESGLALMMDPKTGELLAVAQYPSMDPMNPSSCNQKDQKLKMITDRVEPGSVYKIVTVASALEDKLVTPEQLFDAEDGTWVVPIGKGRIRKIVDDHPHKIISVQRAMEVSSNIVMAKISNVVGAERFFKMSRAFGFGSPTGIELPGENRGVLKKPSSWSRTTLNTMAFGYEVGVTPLQLLCAYSVIANGGYLVRPHIIKKEVDANGNILHELQTEIIRKVLSSSTVDIMKEMFEGVVDTGTATSVRIPGVRIAGKTGTAKRNINGRYEPGKYTATFVGFYPVEDPKIVCLVMLDNPKGGSYYGGMTSGPVFRAIAERIITTTDRLGNVSIEQPVMVQQQLPEQQQYSQPIPETRVEDSMMIQPMQGYSPEERVVPNLLGQSVRKAVGILSSGRLDPVVEGFGVVISQEPTAGKVVSLGTKVILKCEPKSVTLQPHGLN
ncbi:MAG: PASTA domain-containing protein [Ignavibacteriae bacterium]|nr:PASTA domain-containing protein [Ignavibacteriota bacterium]